MPEPSLENQLPAPDFSVMRKITPADRNAFSDTYLQHYEKGDKHLFYVGAKHGVDFENRTHEIIGQSLSKHPPQLIIIEGIETEKGVSPSLGLDPKNPQHRERFMLHSSEAVHTAEAARARHIPFIGGEASMKEIFSELNKRGYSNKDAMALLLVRMIPNWERNGDLKDTTKLPGMAARFLANNPQFDFIPKEERLTFDEFKAIYDTHKAEMGKDFAALKAHDSNPNNTDKANYFQKMSAVMDQVRDHHLINLIHTSLGKADKVMVVYGNAHQFVATPVLEKMFDGKPRIENLQLNEQTPAVPAAAPVPVQTMPKPAPQEVPGSGTTMAMKLGSAALLGGALTSYLMGGAPITTMLLLATSGVALAGSLVNEHRSRPVAPAAVSVAPVKAASPEKALTPQIEQQTSRSDGKSWVASAQVTGEQQARSI